MNEELREEPTATDLERPTAPALWTTRFHEVDRLQEFTEHHSIPWKQKHLLCLGVVVPDFRQRHPKTAATRIEARGAERQPGLQTGTAVSKTALAEQGYTPLALLCKDETSACIGSAHGNAYEVWNAGHCGRPAVH